VTNISVKGHLVQSCRDTDNETHKPADCSTWTTKVIGKNSNQLNNVIRLGDFIQRYTVFLFI